VRDDTAQLFPVNSNAQWEAVMRLRQALRCLVLAVACQGAALAAPFVVFPNAGQLSSPDRNFVVRSTDRVAPMSEFAGDFHSLFLEDASSGHTRKLFDYVGVVAVAWADNDFIIVTEYLSKRTSRALVFPVEEVDPVVIDKPSLTSLVPETMRPVLRENDHVFIEVTGVQGQTLKLRVWGYGKHDAKGFGWHCQYGLRDGGISCSSP
jgi:hypothetical protein